MTEPHNHVSAASEDVTKRLLARVQTHDRMTMGSDQALGYYSAWDAKLMREAADEIERLRHDLDRHMQIAVDVLNDAQGAPDSLREALRPFAKISLWRDMYPDAKEDFLTARQIQGYIKVEDVRRARAALAAQPPAAPAETKSASEMIAACYEGLCPDGSSALDFEWARQRGYILPNNGSGKLSPAQCSAVSEDIARTIALSYGRDPDALTEWTEMCDAHNRPVPIWKVYEEQAEALLASYSITRPHRGSAD